MSDASLPVGDWAERYLEVMHDLVIVAEAKTGTILRTNDAARERLESLSETLVGSYVVKLVHRDDRHDVADALAALSPESPECQLTLRLNDPDQLTHSTFRVYLRFVPETGEILVANREITELSRSRDQLAHFRRFIELTADIMVVTKLDGTIIDCNPAACEIHGETMDSIRGRSIEDFVHADGKETWRRIPELVTEGDGKARYTIAARRGDGSPILFDCITIVDWEQRLAYTVERDITEAENQKHRLEVADRFFTLTTDLLARVDPEHRLVQCNRAFADFAGGSGKELTGQSIFEIFGDIDGSLRSALERLSAVHSSETVPAQDVIVHSAAKRQRRTFSMSLQRDNASASIFVAARDTTDEQHLTAELRTLAETDALTGLANRTVFEQRLQTELDADRTVAVAFLDLDNFKKINDSLGHATGDDMLKVVSKRLNGCVRANDVVSRFGGDEFCVMLTDLGPHRTVNFLARVIRDAINDPMVIDGRRLVISCSVGLAISTPDITDASELLKRGDAAAYTAKEEGRNKAVVFDDALQDRVTDRFELEEELRAALLRSQLDLDVQGIFDRDLKLAGVEALLRWDHPTRGRLVPADFLEVAEDAGLMGAISDQVITRAFEVMAPWLRANVGAKLSVNLSPGQLANPALVGRLSEASRFYGAPPQQIVLEITEDALVESVERTFATLERLKNEGFWLAMDDFGKGASSLGHLRDFPFEAVKIDKGFIDSIESDSVNTAIVEAVIGLANRLGMRVIAEGIESEEHVQALVKLGCHRLQGYHLHRPEPIEEALVLRQTAVSNPSPS